MQTKDLPEGTFTGTGLDLLVGGFEPRPATDHIATAYVDPPRLSRWRRVLVWFGLADD